MSDVIQGSDPKYSFFDRSRMNLFSCEMGELVPTFVEEIIPGDNYTVTPDILIRFAPQKFPTYSSVRAKAYYFFCMNRINWSDVDHDSFMSGGPENDSTIVLPYASKDSAFNVSSVADYMGMPTHAAIPYFQTLPFRHFADIWNEWFRDQNLQDEIVIDKSSGGPDTEMLTFASGALPRACWRKDYFTSATPWPQRGADVLLPIGDTVPVTIPNTDGQLFVGHYDNVNNAWRDGTVHQENLDGSMRAVYEHLNAAYSGSGARPKVRGAGQGDPGPNGSLSGTADLSEATAATIRDQRLAWQLQAFQELNAVGGVRYPEFVLTHFGVRSDDGRLYRPEYLGGASSKVLFSEIPQTSATDSTPQGNLAGHGYAAFKSQVFNRTFKEHGYIIGLLTIMPDTIYMQGIPRHFLKKTKYDFYLPVFAHVGAQPIYNAEIYATGDAEDDFTTWAWQDRYEEYRQAFDEVHGDFRTTYDFFHLARKFDSLPEFNEDFVASDPDNRIFPVTAEGSHVWVMLYHKVNALRKIPIIGTPGLVDHK